MKLHCPNILLFGLPLNIFVSLSSYVNNKNKPYITAGRTPIYTSRVLSECDTQSSIYDYYEDMKSVKENFDRQTSQRFQEYEERMKDKRQKRKEERDKNVQKIIEKDKMEKSLEEKVEKGCLRCGCALGGGVLPVWCLVSGLWYATWSQYVTQKALSAGIYAGIAKAIDGVKTKFLLDTLGDKPLAAVITSETYNKPMFLFQKIYGEYNTMCVNGTLCSNSFFNSIKQKSTYNTGHVVQTIKESVSEVATQVVDAAKNAEKAAITAENATSTQLYSAIGYSVLAILIIVLVMIIIYLVLRYRRKKKMNKKAQYTQLLNQ
ncbi:rifin PIR protein, putative [Plasmodium reichenowi]|uniref:Rifin PIR protein, putative n=1 Tax=Plasmodium reichenowi TaxID=5854 RepID=A0A2P9D3Y7_PLARE|nr:rifin PIR protein, putative [Plasmodium reichenowi]